MEGRYPDLCQAGGVKALEDWLSVEGVKNINNVNDRLKAAKPWYSFYGASSAAALS